MFIIYKDIEFVDGYKIYGNYIISEHGIIENYNTGEVLKENIKNAGYKYVRLPIDENNNKRNFYVHRVMLNTYDPIDNPNDYVVDHIDLDRGNNNIYNLRWLTQKENIHHSIKQGTFTQHKDQGVLTDDDVHYICRGLEKGLNPMDLYPKFKDKVELTTIQKIKTGTIHKGIYANYDIHHRKNKYKYNWKSMVVSVCDLLEKNLTTREIADTLNFDTSETLERQKFWKFVKRIREKESYVNISENYNF